MKNIRISAINVIDSTNISAIFSSSLIDTIDVTNVSISSQVPNVPDPTVLTVDVVGNTLNIQTQPLTPFSAYLITFISTQTSPFLSLNGDAILLQNNVANSQIIIGPIESDNAIKEYLTNYLRSNVYDISDSSVIGKNIQAISTVFSRALYDIKQSKNDNYLSFTVIDEQKTRSPGPFDRLDEEGAYEVLRVGINRTGSITPLKLTYAVTPSDPISVLQTLNSEYLTINTNNANGTFNLNDLTLNLSERFIIQIKTITFIYSNSTPQYTYNIDGYGYQIKDSRYDTDFAFTYLILNDNQIKLNSKILEDPKFSTNALYQVYVVYNFKDTGRVIDATSLVVDTVIPSGREAVPPLLNIFSLLHAPIVDQLDNAGTIGSVTFTDPNQLLSLNKPHPAFIYEILFRLEALPMNPGEYAVDYTTGTVYVYGQDTLRNGTGEYPPIATYFYSYVYKNQIDYVYDIDFNDLVALPNGSMVNNQSNIEFNFEKVLAQDIDYKADVHNESLNERIGNHLLALNVIKAKNSPVTNVFRIYNETSGELYSPLRWNDNKIYFTYTNPPTINDFIGERPSFDVVPNEILFVSQVIATASPSINIFKIYLNNNNIMADSEDCIGSVFNSSAKLSNSSIFTNEIYFDNFQSEVINLLRLTTDGYYQVDYTNGIVYCAVPITQDFNIGTITYKRSFIITSFPHITSIEDIYYRISLLNPKGKKFKYIKFDDGYAIPSSLDSANERYLNNTQTLPYIVSANKVGALINAIFTAGVSQPIKYIRGLYEVMDLEFNTSPINFAPTATFTGSTVTLSPLTFSEYHSVQFDGVNHYILLNTNLLYQSPNITIAVTVTRSSDSANLWSPVGAIVLGSPIKLVLDGGSGAVTGDAVTVTYSYTINNLSGIVIDYNKGDYFIDYSYLQDEIIISYEYGDNVIDFRQSSALNAGDQYFVSYRAGALRDALLKNFGTLINIPILNNLDIDFERERYRDALTAALQSFIRGPTIAAMKEIVSKISHTPTELIESAFQNWSLGNSLLNRQPIKATGAFELLPGKYHNGVQINQPDQTVSFPTSSNLRLEDGTLEGWLIAEWDGLDNQSTLNINLTGPDGYAVPENNIFVGGSEYHPEYNIDFSTNIHTLTLDKTMDVQGTPNMNKNGVFIYYDKDAGGQFNRWYLNIVDGYVDGYRSGTYKTTIKTNGRFYDFKSTSISDGYGDGYIYSGTNSATFIATNLHNTPNGVTFVADNQHYFFDFGEGIGKNRFSIYKDESGYINFRVIDAKGITYSVSADISAWKSGQQHHIAASWNLNTKYRRDELHLFIDGQEVPNIIKYGNKTNPYLHEKFRTIDPEEIVGVISKNIVGSSDLLTTLGSSLVTSSINFTAYGININDTLYVEELGFNALGYNIINVNGQTLTLSSAMPMTAKNLSFSVNKTSFVVDTEIEIYPNIAVSLSHSILDGYANEILGLNTITSTTNFTTAGILAGDLIKFEDGYSHYIINTVSGTSLILNSPMPITINTVPFHIYTNTGIEIPGVRAVRPAYEISTIQFDGYSADILTIRDQALKNDLVLINTLGVNNKRLKKRHYIWGDLSTVVNASNTTPIRITTSRSTDYGTGDYIPIVDVLGNTNANGTFKINVISSTQFDLYDGYNAGNPLGNPVASSGLYTGGGMAGTGVNVIKTQLDPPVSLDEVSVTKVLLTATAVGPSNSTFGGVYFTTNNYPYSLPLDQSSNSTAGRRLTVSVAGTHGANGDNVDFSFPVHIAINGIAVDQTTKATGAVSEPLYFSGPGSQDGLHYYINGYQDGYEDGYIGVVCKPFNSLQNCCVVEVKEKLSITIPDGYNSALDGYALFPVIRYSYQVRIGTTLTSDGVSTVSDANGFFTSLDVNNYLLIHAPGISQGFYQITAVSADHKSATVVSVNGTLTIFTGTGVYEILNFTTYRSGLQNGFFTFEDSRYPGVPYYLTRGLYEFDYPAYLSIPIDPKLYKAYVGSDLNGANQINAIVDEMKIYSSTLTDIRVGEIAQNNVNYITKDFNSLKALTADQTTLSLLHFDTYPFVDSSDVYIIASNKFLQSGKSVNESFNQSVCIANNPIVVDNLGILNTKTEGSIEFWVSPLFDTANDPNYRFYFDASGIVSEKIKSTNSTTVKVAGKISQVLSVKLQVGNNNIDYFAGGTIDADLQTIHLNQQLPSEQMPIIVNYIPSGVYGDRISIYKDNTGYINFDIRAAAIDYQVRAPIFWTNGTWHRIKTTYKLNKGIGLDELKLYVDGYEMGNVLFGSGLLFGQYQVFGSTYVGSSAVQANLSFKDSINEFTIGGDYAGNNTAYALIDNLRISNISRPQYMPFGESIDVNYSPNLNTVVPVLADLYTTYLLDFNSLIVKNTDFATLKNKKTGLFDFTVNIPDSFRIISGGPPKVKAVLETLIKTLAPANSRVFINYE